MMSGQNKYDVIVLMSSYNGEKYIEEQIESIFKQENVKVKLIIRDDGSNDSSIEIINRLSNIYDIKLINGTNMGAKASFFELIKICPKSKYVAFCDQDDFWKKDKLYTAVKKLEDYQTTPSMYFSNLCVVNENLVGNKNMFNHLSSTNLGQSLTYNTVVGCTLVINFSLLCIIKKSLSINPCCYHDQWISLVCSCVNGIKIVDNEPHILYRQHGSNCVGAEENIIKKIKKSSFFAGKNFRSQIAKQLDDCLGDLVKADNKEVLNIVLSYKSSLTCKFKLIFSGYNNNGFFSKLTFIVTVLLNLY